MKILVSDCTGLGEDGLSRFFDALPPARRAYAARYANPLDRATAAVGFLLVSALIREVSPDYPLSDWKIGEHGKPYLSDAPFHFSLSHADGLCAAALSEKPIGLDVERIRPLRPALLPRFCTQNEILACQIDPELAVKIWTKREARAKEDGRGIGQNLVALPTEGVSSYRITSGRYAFWLSCTTTEPAKIVTVKPEELLKQKRGCRSRQTEKRLD